MRPLQIVIPMAGRGSRFAQAGFTDPKPLIPVGGQPMIQWVIDNVRPQCPHVFTFVCLAEHLARYPQLAPRLREICPGAHIVPVETVTEGAACTVLLAREIIDSSDPLMIANSDQVVEVAIDDYLAAGDDLGIDGWIMTFASDHPKWSYARLGPDGRVTEVVEKQVVSNEATVGIYNFQRGADFVRAADAMIAADFRVNGEFYVAPTYNQLIAEGRRITVFRIGEEFDTMHGLGTPEDLAVFVGTPYFQGRLTGKAAN
jgi:NDP-sugar pyrophosphorylase family protein